MNSEYLLRGVEGLDSRAYSDALDRLGARRSVSADAYFMRIAFTVAGENLLPAISLMSKMVRRPAFPESALEPIQSLCLQELAGLEDDPSHLCSVELDRIRLPSPFDRHGMGTVDSVSAATRDDLAAHFSEHARPGGSIFAASGAVDHEEIARHLDELLADWEGEASIPSPVGEPLGGTTQVDRATAQTHLGMGLNAPVASDPDSLPFRVATAAVGGGASSRLFLEVRERRGLAYSVGCRYEPGYLLGTCTLSAGTTPERVSETIECIEGVLEGIEAGFRPEEVRRVQTQLRSGSLMQQEQGPARARQLAVDQFRLGRPRSLEDLLAEFDALNVDLINEVSGRWMDAAWRSAATRSIVGPSD